MYTLKLHKVVRTNFPDLEQALLNVGGGGEGGEEVETDDDDEIDGYVPPSVRNAFRECTWA